MIKLTELPAELRLRIYEFVLPSGRDYRLNIRPPAITRANRFLRRETLTMWREQNVFAFDTNGRNARVLVAPLYPLPKLTLHAGFHHIRRFDYSRIAMLPRGRPVIQGRVEIVVRVTENAYSVEIRRPFLDITSPYRDKQYEAWTEEGTLYYTALTVEDMVATTEVILSRRLTPTETIVW